MKPAPCSWRVRTWRDAGARQGAVHLDIVDARNAEDGIDAVGFEQPDQGLAGRRSRGASRMRPQGLAQDGRRRTEAGASLFTAWQATRLKPAGSSSGRSTRQRSKASGQRGLKAQPGGGSSGEGSSPFSTMRSRLAAPDRRSASPRAAPAYRDARRREDLVARALLDGAAEIHHHHVVGDVAHDREVVADEEIGEAELAPAVGEQVQHLRLDRHVERRDRLVEHQDLRDRASARGRWRCAGAGRRRTCADSGRSARAAGRRCAIIAAARFACARPGRHARVDEQRLLERVADLLARIERAVGVLEDDLHLAPQRAQRLGRCADDSMPSICSAPAGRLLDHGDDARERRLAAARFADHGEGLAAARR